jgi:multisubunit Na+/H+ antiporter MnhB subunit
MLLVILFAKSLRVMYPGGLSAAGLALSTLAVTGGGMVFFYVAARKRGDA